MTEQDVRRQDTAAGAGGSPRHDTQVPQENVRNFSIVAHIDHGKSTLADRLLELCGAVAEGEGVEQMLDDMDLERERGITIKSSAVRLLYQADDGETYQLNLIDTPGHVDFSYEVSRSLSACEGAVVLVDVSQGVEAQTVANVYLSLDAGLEIIPVANKIDIPNIPPQPTIQEMVDAFAFEPDEILLTSGKTGEGVHELLEAIIERIPPPSQDPNAPLRAMIFDSEFDVHQGVIATMRVFEGTVRPGDDIQMMATGNSFEVNRLGVLTPEMQPVEELRAGDVGCLTAGIKNVQDSRVGDTITSADRPAAEQGRARQALAQRRRAALRARDLGGARLRLPLRLPGPAAHGDRTGAAGARV